MASNTNKSRKFFGKEKTSGGARSKGVFDKITLFRTIWADTEPLPNLVIESKDSGAKLVNFHEMTDEEGSPQQTPTKTSQISDLVLMFESSQSGQLKQVEWKNLTLSEPLLTPLISFIETFATLTTIHFEYCNLGKLETDILNAYLWSNTNITELSLDGNPSKAINYASILKHKQIRVLSFRFCKLEADQLKLMMEELQDPFDSSLIHLNLSSNYIDDEAAEHIGTMLRTNRTLLSLNLADNFIYDAGCLEIVKVLEKFLLREEEILIKRRLMLAFYRKKWELDKINNQKIKMIAELTGEDPMKSLSGKQKRTSAKPSTRSTPSSAGGTKVDMSFRNTAVSVDLIPIDLYLEEELKAMQHPMVKETFVEKSEVFCKGNFRLIHLNLAYNKLTLVGLTGIVHMLMYQEMRDPVDGISRIVLAGNKMLERPECAEELDIVYELSTKKSKAMPQFEAKGKKRSKF